MQLTGDCHPFIPTFEESSFGRINQSPILRSKLPGGVLQSSSSLEHLPCKRQRNDGSHQTPTTSHAVHRRQKDCEQPETQVANAVIKRVVSVNTLDDLSH